MEPYKITETDALFQKTFTDDQKVFIQYQINDWCNKLQFFLDWDENAMENVLKDAKKELKRMICGDGDE